MRRILLFIILISSSTVVRTQNTGLEKLASLLEGVFSSELQAAKDTSFFSVRLEMRRLARSSPDTIWMYVEQAMNKSTESPYRQRLQRVYQMDNVFISETFEFPEPPRYVGGKGVDSIPFTQLIRREGCAVYIHKFDNEYFKGNTNEKSCVSTHRGAQYATTEIEIRPEGLYTWDRGFNSTDEQVWGSKTGGYRFVRLTVSPKNEGAFD